MEPQSGSFTKEAGSASALPTGPTGRLGWMFGALALALVSGLIAFNQAPRPDPFEEPGGFGWLRYPLEWNAHRRLPAVTGRINAVFARDGIRRLVVVGDGGLILSSDDDGRSWRQDSIVLDSALVADEGVEAVAPQDAPTQSPVQQNPYGGAANAKLPSGRLQKGEPEPATPRRAAPRSVPSGRISWDFFAVDFADDSTGIVLANAAAFMTRDGGRSWNVAFRTPNGDALRAAHLVSADSGWISDVDGEEWTTGDGWKSGSQTKDRGPRLERVHFTTPVFGAGIHSIEGTLWITTKGGSPWRMLPRKDRPGLAQVLFTRPLETAIAIDTLGALLESPDSGSSWRPVQGDSGRFSALAYRSGTLYTVTRDGQQLLAGAWNPSRAESWRPILGRPSIARLSILDEQRAWLVGRAGELFRTTDGARKWAWLAKLDGEPLTLRFAGADEGAAVLRIPGARSFVLALSRDGGRSWDYNPTPDSDTVRYYPLLPEALGAECDSGPRCEAKVVSVTADTQTAWRYDQGVLYRTRLSRDSVSGLPVHIGAVEPDLAGTRLHLRALAFTADLAHGIGASSDGLVYTTSDTGRTWHDPTPYSRWPAPWYYLSWVLVGLMVARGLARPQDPPPIESVADMLISDRPIRQGEPDATGLNRIATGLAGFLRNKKTQPPITIAVTGKWGTGKSSLMNLLRDNLTPVGYRAVWFNAWHHQKEEHLLAALLETVQRDVVPPKLSWDGLEFRSRLLAVRFARYKRLAVVLLLVMLFSLGYLLSHRAQTWAQFEALAAWFKSLGERGKESELGSDIWGGLIAAALTLAGAAAGPIVTVMKGLKAFGAAPATLMASMQGAFKLRDVKAQTSFRHEFMRDFQEVTHALGDRRLIIFIDDLDRCQPENVVEVLEAISFLVSAGDCIIVLGMDREYVDGCVGLRFKVVAEELSTGTGGADAGDGGREVRRIFARHYLQKLVNIEVPVPAATEDQLRDVILPPKPPVPERPPLQRLRPLARVAATVAVVLLGAAAFTFGYTRKVEPPAVQQAAPSTDVRPSPGDIGTTARDSQPVSAIPEDPDTSTVDLLPGATGSSSRLLLWLGLLAIIAATVVSLLRRPVPTIQDSPEFAAALERWTPLVYRKTKTPREMKRFLNRVRLYAMQQHPPRRTETVGSRISQMLGRWINRSAPKPEQVTPPAPTIEEDVLVALTALDTYDTRLLDQLSDPAALDDLPPEARKEVVRLRRELEAARTAYREQARGVRVE